jgi:MFS family permease
MVPDALRARVMAIYSMMFMGMAPFGALLAGTLADRIGAPATVAAGGAVCILGALVFGARLPTLRPQARRIILAQQAAAGEPAQGITGSATQVMGADGVHSLKAKGLTRDVSADRDWRGKQA